MDYTNPSKRTKPIPGGETEEEYRRIMKKIMDGLTKENLEAILFLCKDYIPQGREITSPLQFLKYIEDRDLVSVDSAVFMAEILHIIRRMDLLKIIPCIRNKKHFEEQFLGLAYVSFDSYRVLTVQLQDELSSRDFETFRYECTQHLNIRSLDAASSVLSLLRKLEEEDVISSDDYENLIKILKSIENVKPLKLFQRLLEGDETVAVPAGKQLPRQDSSQAIFPDRNYVQPQINPSSAFGNGHRVEVMPYAGSLPPQYETQQSQRSSIPPTPTTYIEPTTKEKSHFQEMRMTYNFEERGMTMVPNPRWFRSDEVIPKTVGEPGLPYEQQMQYQSMPPAYSRDTRRHYSNDGAGTFASMPSPYAQSPPHYEETPFQERPNSIHYVNSYPQMHYGSPHFHNQQRRRFDSPPQSMYGPQIPQHTIPPRHAMSFPSMPVRAPPGNHTLTPLTEQISDISLNQREDNLDSQGQDMFVTSEEDEDSSNKATVSLEEATVKETPASSKPVESQQAQEMEELRKRNEELEKVLEEQKNFGSYKMDASPVGLCILINNVQFEKNRKYEEYNRRKQLQQVPLPRIDLTDRVGSDVDADKLEKLFTCLDFIVERHDDLDQRGIRRVLIEAGSKDHSEFDCFMLIVLTHGDNGCIFGVDGFSVTNAETQKSFNAENCASLAGKPKIFIIQACQGRKEMPSYAPDSDITHDGPSPEYLGDGSTPSKADFLLAYSTVPGYLSYRSRVAGSYFVLEIVRTFKKHYQTQDLLSMMIKVNDEVAKYDRKQVPMPVPTLRKKVFFHLKEGCTMDDVDEEYQDENALLQELGAVGGTTLAPLGASAQRMFTQETGEQEE